MTAHTPIRERRPVTAAGGPRRWAAPLLLALFAVAFRAPHLGRLGYDLDEMWTAEVSVGRGSLHATLPTDQLIWPAPALARPADRPAAWHVWSHMDITQPPLYSVLLRLWQDVVGTGDGRERALSVIASVAAVVLLYDAVRVRSGPGPAFWAAALLAASVPQVEYARIVRGYALLMATLGVVASAAARTEVRGPTRWRSAALTAGVAATLLTHYFGVAPVAAVAVHAAAFVRGPARRAVLTAVVVGVTVVAAVWFPFVPAQLHLFRPDDVATDFLRRDVPGHVAATARRVVLAPVSMLFPLSSTAAPFAAAGAVLYAVPVLGWVGRTAATRRATAGLAFWGLWLCASVGLLATLDLARGTTHLFFIRYALSAGPAVCALVPTALATALRVTGDGPLGLRWLAHAVPAVAVVAALLALPFDVYAPVRSDPRELTAILAPPALSPDDLLVFAGTPREAQFTGAYYLLIDRYLGPVPCPIVVLTGPAPTAVLARARASRHVWMVAGVDDHRFYLPTARLVGNGTSIPTLGRVWSLRVP